MYLMHLCSVVGVGLTQYIQLEYFTRKVSRIAATFVSAVAMSWIMLASFDLRPFAFKYCIVSLCSCLSGEDCCCK